MPVGWYSVSAYSSEVDRQRNQYEPIAEMLLAHSPACAQTLISNAYATALAAAANIEIIQVSIIISREHPKPSDDLTVADL